MSKRARETPLDERATPMSFKAMMKRAAVGGAGGGSAQGKMCVIGVDFGTSRTGYAYAFLGNPDEIVSKQPGGQEAGKTHSSILLDTNCKFLAFGAKAREMYFEHEEQGLFFENYKMGFHDDLVAAPQATALNGRKVPLLTVITETLKFVRKEAMEEVNRSQLARQIDIKDVQWVVTVPAIWTDKAKGVMREAVYKAGMIASKSSENLQFAIEPEAACMSCEDDSKHMKVGDSFMVLDCGGGTVDITISRLTNTSPRRMEELAVPSGGPWGSTYVDKQFEHFIEDLIGPAAWGRFKPSAGWVELMEGWEAVKLGCNSVDSFDGDLTRAITVGSLIDFLDEGQTIASVLAEYNSRHGTDIKSRRSTTILLPLSKIQSFFRVVVDKICHHVENLLAATPVNYILLVGGFAESKLLLHRVRNAFEKEGTKVVVPVRPQLAVVKGAVSFSLHGGQQIQSRLARFTYGFQAAVCYHPSACPPSLIGKPAASTMYNGRQVKCCDILFVPMVVAGTRVHAGFTVERDVSASCDRQTSLLTKIFVSTRPDVNFVTDSGVQAIGSVVVPLVPGQSAKFSLGFGSTEIEVTLHNKHTGKRKRAAIDYSFSDL